MGGLRADLGCLPLGMEGEQGLVGLSVDFGPLLLRREGLCGVESLMGLLTHTIFAIFCVPLGG